MRQWTNFAVAGLLLGGLVVSGTPARAQGVNDPNIQRREWKQEQRIQEGVQSGRLTPREGRHLEAQQRHIQNAENRMKADGRLTSGERARLNHMENRASRNIYRKKHNSRYE